MSRITRSVFAPSNLRLAFSAAGLVPLVNIWHGLRQSVRFLSPRDLHCAALVRNRAKSPPTLLRSLVSVTARLVDQLVCRTVFQRLARVRMLTVPASLNP